MSVPRPAGSRVRLRGARSRTPGPSSKLEERTGGCPAGVTGPHLCFEGTWEGWLEPGPRLAGPGTRWRWIRTKILAGSWGGKGPGVRNQARARTHRTQWILFQDEGKESRRVTGLGFRMGDRVVLQ